MVISCWSLNVANPVPGVVEGNPASKNYEGGFYSELMLKDLHIAIESAGYKGLKLDFVEKTAEIYEEIVAGKMGKKDFGYVYEFRKNKKD